MGPSDLSLLSTPKAVGITETETTVNAKMEKMSLVICIVSGDNSRECETQ